MIDVLIVEDSALLRRHLAHLLEGDGSFRVVGQVASGEEACAFLERHVVSVVTMDIHMPGMGGFEATRRIMESTPVPIVIVSACWEPEDVGETFRAMEAGAVSIVSTPKMDVQEGVEELLKTVRQAAEARVKRLRPRRQGSSGARSAERSPGGGRALPCRGNRSFYGGPPGRPAAPRRTSPDLSPAGAHGAAHHPGVFRRIRSVVERDEPSSRASCPGGGKTPSRRGLYGS